MVWLWFVGALFTFGLCIDETAPWYAAFLCVTIWPFMLGYFLRLTVFKRIIMEIKRDDIKNRA